MFFVRFLFSIINFFSLVYIDRYENLPYASKKLRFLKMQITLMDDYRLRLCQINRDELKDPLSKTNFGVLNAINYILFILDEWKNSKVY